METSEATKKYEDSVLPEGSASGKEMIFSDAFISYRPALAFRDIAINRKDVGCKTMPDLCQLAVRNETDFSYTATLCDLPDWCFWSGDKVQLTPGKSADFNLGIKVHSLPPGTVVGECKVVIKRPFIRLAYPIHLSASVKYNVPIPLVRVEVLSYQHRKLRIVVTNGGTGILQGYCYNLETQKVEKFYLSRYNKKPSTTTNDYINQDLDNKQELSIEQSFQNCVDKRQGIIIMTDCPIQNFRRIDINPEKYLDSVKFADKSVLHFFDMKEKSKKEINIEILHRSYSKKCKITIPDHLKPMIRIKYQQSGIIGFRCFVEDITKIGELITGHIDFQGLGNNYYSLPIAITPKRTK